jgi:hypothetical protein
MPPKTKKMGAPSKKDPEAIRRALEVAESGLPLRFIAAAANVSTETLLQWRRNDEKLDRNLESTRLVGVRKKWDAILAAAETNPSNSWSALAWALERGFPSEFGRPEVQLNAQFNSTTTTNHNNLTISVEQAEALTKRSRQIDAEIDKSTEAFLARRRLTNGRDPVREIETELAPNTTTTTLPPPISRSPNWWRELSRGDGHRGIAPEAAEFILRAVAIDVLGGAKAASLKLDMDEGALELHDVWDTLQELFGPSGMQALVRRGEA